MSRLFTPLTLRGVTFRNRIFVSPMCQYSSHDGLATDWHLVHLGSRAVGGAGLVMVEATAVSPEGRISPEDSGIWDDRHAEAFLPITRFIRAHGAIPGIQLAHAGRKASTDAPWRDGAPLAPDQRGWQPVAPSPVPFAPGHPLPLELAADELERIEAQFSAAAGRAIAAGFDVVEVHMAHGYLLHEFLSPFANRRSDSFGGSLENRLRFPLRVARAVRTAWPQDRPVFVAPATDWPEGMGSSEAGMLARQLRKGIDSSTLGRSPPTSRFRPGPATRSPLPPPSAGRPASPPARSVSSPPRPRPSRLSPLARRTWSCLRGNCSATPIGRCTPRAPLGLTFPGRCSTSGPKDRRS
jgi:2,4-dienoyl-CoA reductase-like NADH-dependent reductase (Old Yellow Enzyme family)